MKSSDSPFENPPSTSRRGAIKHAAAGLASFAAASSLVRSAAAAEGGAIPQQFAEKQLLTIETPGDATRPLDSVTLRCRGTGTLCLWDGQGREYFRAPAKAETRVTVAGALGHHLVLLEDGQGRIVSRATFRVDCETGIEDGAGIYGDLLGICQHTFVKFMPQMGLYHYRLGGRNYRLYFGWIHDSTHGFKGLRYFEQGFKDNVDLLALWQWPDGMVPNRYRIYAKGSGDNWENHKLDPIGHCKRVEGPDNLHIRVVRLPVMNDPEYCFIKQLYLAWQTTGDTAWMTGKLDHAIRAVEYATSNEYIWSEKFQLLKRGYTIDGWDYVSEYDKFGEPWANFMTAPGKTVFGVFHGDNTGFAHSLRLLAKMLAAAGRPAESRRYAKLADEFMDRLDKIAWTGTHYRNHVSEDPSFQRDFGVDEDSQIGQSNAFALTRGLSHAKCVEIIRAYQRIRRELPEG